MVIGKGRRQRAAPFGNRTGERPPEDADRLVITLRAVEKYVSTILDKLGIPSTGGQSPAGAGRAALPEVLTGRPPPLPGHVRLSWAFLMKAV